MEHFRRKRFLVAAGILVVLVAGLGGCATKRFTDVRRHAPTGIESGEQISIVLRRYEECDPERCKESLSERIETHFASCLTSSAQAVTPALTVVQTSKIRPAAFPDMSFDQFPRSVESWISLFGDADFRQRIRPLNLRYLVLLEVSTGVTSTKTNLGGGSGSFPMWGITRHWEKYSSFKAEILDLKALRSSGVVTSTVRGEAGYMVPVILILPLPPIPYTTATESSGCADIGKAISSFILQDPTAVQQIVRYPPDALRRPVNPSTPPPPRWTELRHVGKMSVTDVLPAGELYVATPGVARRAADKDERWLIVDFDVPTAKGEQSYAASITANCLTGELSVDHSMTYLDQRAAGEQVGYHLHTPRLVVKNPTGSLASAVRNICDKTTAQETQTSD